MIVGYSGDNQYIKQDRQAYEQLRVCAQNHDCELDIIYSGIDINELRHNILHRGDVLIISDIVCLGRSLQEIRNTLGFCVEHDISLYSAKEGYSFGRRDKKLLEGFDFALSIRGNLASATTSAALNRRREQGIRLGLAKGQKIRKKLDGHLSEIRSLSNEGLTREQIAKHLGVSVATLYNFIRENKVGK